MVRGILFSFILLLSGDSRCCEDQSSDDDTESLTKKFDNIAINEQFDFVANLTEQFSICSINNAQKQSDDIAKIITQIHDNTVQAREFIGKLPSILRQYDTLSDDSTKKFIGDNMQKIHSGIHQYLQEVEPYIFLINDPQYRQVRKKLFELNRCVLSCYAARMQLERRINSIVKMNTD